MERNLSYEEFKEIYKEPKYFNQPCFIPGCKNLAEYEGGDSRFYCGVCEQHSGIQERYNNFVDKYKYRTIPFTTLFNPSVECDKYNF